MEQRRTLQQGGITRSNVGQQVRGRFHCINSNAICVLSNGQCIIPIRLLLCTVRFTIDHLNDGFLLGVGEWLPWQHQGKGAVTGRSCIVRWE